MNRVRKSFKWFNLLVAALFLIGLAPIPSVAAVPVAPAPTNAEINITLDGQRDSGYIKIAADPSDDLNGPDGWEGTQWTDLTNLYVAADSANLYVYADLPLYNSATSVGQIGLILDVDANPLSGGSTDPWGTAITFAYDHVDGTSNSQTRLPDYVIRGNVGGWTELRTWNSGNWNTGSGENWGGIVDGSTVGTHIAYANGNGVEFSIPLANIGNAEPANVHLQLLTTQNGPNKGSYDTIPSDDQSNGWDDPTTQTRLVSAPLAVDAAGDLASGSIATFPGVAWMDNTRLHIWSDHENLYLFIPSSYDQLVSVGQFALAIDTKSGGGTSDPWGNAITFGYTSVDNNLGHAPSAGDALPDYIIRGNIFGPSDGGWTELRAWNGADWTGGGIDWGGIGNSGLPAQPGSNVAWTTNEGLRLRIPFANIGVTDGNSINLEFLATQSGGGKGAYDTVPDDDQSTTWDDATMQVNMASYSIPHITLPSAAHDNNIWWGDLGHNSRDALFRTPGGPVETNTPVTLRLRAAAGDLTGAQVRLYNDRTNAETTLNMTLATVDDTYEWWEAQVSASTETTIYWYRFIAIDGTARAYYEDDAARTGGWGQTFATSLDNSWQLTVYDPTYTTPEWVKNAVIYQIFPDRFRDGDSANNTPAGSFFYNEVGGTVKRSLTDNWNTVVCDPRAPGACSGTYSKNFYGGDLDGIIEQLDYLQELGVTAIYLNPIFESPSNHKYDTTDYLQIDDNFGTLADFQTLATQAEARGMHIILDGVFNHTSSDSLYFDRYHRYGTTGVDDNSGACESSVSDYYDWFYFPAFSNAGSDNGVPATCLNGPADEPQTYEAWYGYSSLPKLQANSTQARDLIWAQDGSVARFWLEQGADGWRLDVGGDVDPGVTNAPTNDYWEGFRDALHAVDPDAYIVGEEWGNASPWLLGQEWDATMNYQYSSAMLSFWRDTTFVDNDHNSGSSAGELSPLTPEQLDERLHNLIERYPPEALYAMMNLLGSHDTNRPLFMLDSNTASNDSSIYQNPNYDWSDAITRLKGVTILQMTLPGAPTIYYGDEVGLVGPPTYDGSSWQDDPYNRQPYPWLDETGTPYYAHLQSEANQDALIDYYQLLTNARNTHPALRTGSFDTLKVDNANKVYAYGRLMDDFTDAAVVILNRHTATQDITVNVSGYLPIGAQFTEVLTSTLYTVEASGNLVVDVPANSGAVLVLTSGTLTPPAAPTNLAVTAEGNTTLDLTWDAVTGADEYVIYRSTLSGGGYVQVGTSATNTFIDTGLTNAQTYYYVVRARVTATGLVSSDSNEASGMPHLIIGWMGNLFPTTLTHTIGTTPTNLVYAQVYISGGTEPAGPTPTLRAQLGFGTNPATPEQWTTWADADFNVNVGNNDEFMGSMIPEAVGAYSYTYRFSTTNGRDWQYLTEQGTLTVSASTDTTAPATPIDLHIADFGRAFIELAWTAPADTDVYAYDIYRSTTSGSGFVKMGRVLHPTTEFTDDTVVTGTTYFYHVVALDNSFNISVPSNEVEALPTAKLVEITLNVTVPAVSPGTVYFTRAILPNNTLGDWSPSATALTSSTATLRTTTFTLEDGVKVEFKFTRGSWETVEKDAAGAEITNRSFTVDYGTDGTQTVNLTVESWRDPLVVAFTPPDGSILSPQDALITFTWSKDLPTGALLAGEVTSDGVVIPGTLSYDSATRTVTFTPDEPLPFTHMYTVTVNGQAAGGDLQQVPATWNFWVGYRLWLPVINR